MEIKFPPGVVKTDSDAASVGRYVDTNHVRWSGEYPEKIGGWEKLFETELVGIPRGSHVFRAPSGLEVVAFGTEKKLYVANMDDEPENITPFRDSESLVDPFTTTNGSAIVTVTDAAHGALQGDTVIFDG